MEGKVGRASSFRTSLQIQKQKLLEQSQVSCMVLISGGNLRKCCARIKENRPQYPISDCPRSNQMSSTDQKTKHCSLSAHLFPSYHLKYQVSAGPHLFRHPDPTND